MPQRLVLKIMMIVHLIRYELQYDMTSWDVSIIRIVHFYARTDLTDSYENCLALYLDSSHYINVAIGTNLYDY